MEKNGKLVVLLEQLETSWELFRPKLEGLTDEEFFWQPVPQWWSIRRRNAVRTKAFIGKAEWVLEDGEMSFDNEPMTTIAWLIGHHASSMLLRNDYTFGAKSLKPDDIAFPGTAEDALAFLDEAQALWIKGVKTLSENDLDIIGLCSYPDGLDPEMPFSSVIWWTNRELIHHAAEIGIIREFYKLSSVG